MFNHHKYCVIDVSGLLVAVEDPAGVLNVYLLDGVDGSSSRHSGGDAAIDLEGLSLADDKSKRVRITDPDLIEFVCRLSKRSTSGYRFSYQARVAGAVELDGGEVRLSHISQAFIYDKDRLLKYEPH